MTRAPTRASIAGRNYLALQRLARQEGRATDELLQLFALEAFLDRLSSCAKSRDFVLKGGVLLAAYDLRRPTRDIDMSTRRVRNDGDAALVRIEAILTEVRDDGWLYATPRAETIREGDLYSGLRITIAAELATARVHFHVDLNFGDPIWPGPRLVQVPRLLGGTIAVQGYPLAMIHAEKIVTCVQRGIANTRWRDFADIYLLSQKHPIASAELSTAISVVAGFRQVQMIPLRTAIEGFAELAQRRWAAWVHRQALAHRLPTDFNVVLSAVEAFADPVISQESQAFTWSPQAALWRGLSRDDRDIDDMHRHLNGDHDVDLER